MARLVLRVKRAGRTLGSWSLGEAPLEMTIVDMETGRELGTFTAAGAREGEGAEPEEPDTHPSEERATTERVEARSASVDEVPMAGDPRRVDGDDFTMPLPEPTEATEPTADLMPDTAETEEADLAARVRKSRPRPIPNLAQRASDAGLLGEVPTQEELGDPVLEEDTGITRTLELDTEDEDSIAEIDLEGFEDEPVEEDAGRPTTLGEVVSPAEVWVRRQSEWRSGGHLRPGQRAVARGGWVRLRRDGRLVVRPGPSLSGSATLVDGDAVEIARDVPPIELPAGASVLLRAGEYGLYVRSEPYAPGGRPALGR